MGFQKEMEKILADEDDDYGRHEAAAALKRLTTKDDEKANVDIPSIEVKCALDEIHWWRISHHTVDT
jgi:hypothetical protein